MLRCAIHARRSIVLLSLTLTIGIPSVPCPGTRATRDGAGIRVSACPGSGGMPAVPTTASARRGGSQAVSSQSLDPPVGFGGQRPVADDVPARLVRVLFGAIDEVVKLAVPLLVRAAGGFAADECAAFGALPGIVEGDD